MPYFICQNCFNRTREYFLENILCPACNNPLTPLSQEISSAPQGLKPSTSLLNLTKLKLRTMTFVPSEHGGLILVSDRGSYYQGMPFAGGAFSQCISFNDVVV